MARDIYNRKNGIYLFLFLLVFTLIYLTTNLFTISDKKETARTFQPDSKIVDQVFDTNLSPKIDQWFKKLCTTTRFNGNILVAKDDKVIYENYYGYSNYKNKDTLNLEYRFQTGSVSKIFTSMAVMILKEKGKLSYDDEITKHIPGFPYKGVTVRMLLSHRSGLPNYNYFCDEYTDRETVIRNRDVIKLMIDSIPPVYYQPDERFDYCNTNYVLLAYIVEKIAGLSFEDFMQKEVFRKAGMNNTKIYINGRQSRIYKSAVGYHYPWTVALTTYQDGVTGDKGVFSTVEDLWLWNLALENNLLVKRGTLAEAFEPGSPEKKGGRNYGLGWRLNTAIDGSKLVYHTGWWRGYNAMFVKDLKNNAVIVILSNVRTRALYSMFPELLGIIDPVRRKMQVDADSLYLKQSKMQKDTLNNELEL